MTPTTVCIFFKSRCLTPEFCLRRFQFFQSRRFTPQKRGLNFSKAGAAYLKTGSFHFSKAGATRFKKRHFQFFKSRRFTPQCRLRRSVIFFQKPPMAASNFSKPAFRAWIPPTAVSIFSKAGASRLKNGVWIFPKSVLRTSKPGVSIFQKPAPSVLISGIFNFSKAGASRLNAAYGCNFFFKNRLWRHQNFQSRRFMPEYRLRRFQFFSKAGASRLNVAYGGIKIFKAGASCLNTA